MSLTVQATATSVDTYSDARIDAFFGKLAMLTDNNTILASAGATAITNGNSFVHTNAVKTVSHELRSREVRVDFAEFLHKVHPLETLSAIDLEQYVDLFIQDVEAGEINTVYDRELYRKVSPATLRSTLLDNNCGELIIETFYLDPADDSALVMPPADPLARLNAPLSTINDAVERFLEFSSDPANEFAISLCENDKQRALVFVATRLGAGLADDQLILKELVELV